MHERQRGSIHIPVEKPPPLVRTRPPRTRALPQDHDEVRARVTNPQARLVAEDPVSGMIARALLAKWGHNLAEVDEGIFQEVVGVVGGLTERERGALEKKHALFYTNKQIGQEDATSAEGARKFLAATEMHVKKRSGLLAPEEQSPFRTFNENELREALIRLRDKKGYTTHDLSSLTGLEESEVVALLPEPDPEAAEELDNTALPNLPTMLHGEEARGLRESEVLELMRHQGRLTEIDIAELEYRYRTSRATINRDRRKAQRLMREEREAGETSSLVVEHHEVWQRVAREDKPSLLEPTDVVFDGTDAGSPNTVYIPLANRADSSVGQNLDQPDISLPDEYEEL